MALKLYAEFLTGLLSGTAARRMDIIADTIRVTLHTSTYTFQQDTHNFYDDVSSTELPTANGYTQGGITLAGKTLVTDASFNGPVFDANDISWPTATFQARHAIGHKWTGSAATSPLIFDYDFQTDVAPSGATFQIQWNPAGIFVIGAQ